MKLGQWLGPPRRTLTAFIAMTVALSVALGVAAWWLVRQDREVEGQRARVRVERDLDLIALSLRNWLNEIDLKLASVAAAPSTDPRVLFWVGSSSVVVRLEGSDIRVWPEGRLAFLPDAGPAAPNSAGVIRATALLNDARRLREAGRAEASLPVYDRLAELDARVLNDAPAELVARRARSTVFNDLGRKADLGREAARLLTALRMRPWHLSAGTYAYYAKQATQWLSSPAVGPGAEPFPDRREALAVAVNQLHDDRPASAGEPASERRAVWIDRHSFTVVSRSTKTALVAFVGNASDIVSAALEGQSAGGATTVDFALADSGRTVFGNLPPPSADRIVRNETEAGLPWSIYAAPANPAEVDGNQSLRRAAILGGAGLVSFCVLAGGWFTARAMHREIELARVQSDFVSAVSHEFRTPLASFEQLSELLVDGRVASDADRDEYYRRLHRESRRLRRLVENLLDFRRMEAGAKEFTFEKIDVPSLVAEVAAEFAADHSELDSPRVLPAAKVPLIRADREAIGRALWNLLDNAAKYAPGSAVQVTTGVENGTVRIAVRDEGPGIPSGKHDEVFREFVRANGASAKAVGGTGLGLAMVRRIAEAHGGRATVESAPGRGATFTIELPL